MTTVALRNVAGLTCALAVGLLVQGASAQTMCYRGHVQNTGWQNTVCDGTMAGSAGRGLRMEAVQIFNPTVGGQICYQAHSQNVGWGGIQCNGGVAGTTGAGLRMEALVIWYNSPPAGKQLLFRGHLAKFGWQSLQTAGGMIGQTGQKLSIEALEMNINQGQQYIYWQ